MKRLPLISDVLFAFCAAWLIAAGIFRYILESLAVCLILSSVVAAAVAILVYLWLRALREKKYLAAKDEAAREALMLHLTLDTPENNRRLFARLLKAEENTVERKNGGLLIGENLVYLIFSMQPVSADEIAKIIKKPHEGPKTVYCNTLSKEAAALCDAFHVDCVEGRDLYLRLKEERLLPKHYICGDKRKRSLRERLSWRLKKSLATPYFLSGVSILFLSLFTTFRLYYIIAGSALLTLALLVRIFGKRDHA